MSRTEPLALCEVASESQNEKADIHWRIPAESCAFPEHMTRDAILSAFPDCPRLWEYYRQRDEACLNPETPELLVSPVAPYNPVAPQRPQRPPTRNTHPRPPPPPPPPRSASHAPVEVVEVANPPPHTLRTQTSTAKKFQKHSQQLLTYVFFVHPCVCGLHLHMFMCGSSFSLAETYTQRFLHSFVPDCELELSMAFIIALNDVPLPRS